MEELDELIQWCGSVLQDRSLQGAADRNWQMGKRIDEFIRKKRIPPSEESRLLKKLSQTLVHSQFSQFLRFYREYPNFDRMRKKLSWSEYYVLLPMTPKKRKDYERRLMNGEIKHSKDLKSVLRAERGEK